jgi:hypothetical protein
MAISAITNMFGIAGTKRRGSLKSGKELAKAAFYLGYLEAA